MKIIKSLLIVAAILVVLACLVSCRVLREIDRIHWMNSQVPYFEVPLYVHHW